MPTVWFNQGYASTRDALTMIREEAAGRVRLLASHSDPGAAVLGVADLGFREPQPEDGEAEAARHLGWCLRTCREQGVDLFVPQRARRVLAAHAEAFAAIGVKLAVPADPATLRMLHDKAAFTAAAAAAGLPVAWTREIGDLAGFDAAMAELAALGLPACVKPPQGVFGAGFWKLDEGRSLFAALMDPDARILPPGAIRTALAEADGATPLLVMEHLAGVEWSIDCLCDSGRLLVAVARRKMGRVQLIETDGPVFDIARAAVAAFGLSGLVNVQCRAAGAGDSDPRLLEINARMSGGCLYTRYSGVNLPWWHVALALGLADETEIPAPVAGALVAPVGEATLVEALLADVAGHA